ncbi:MAG: hypothetical protein GWN24_00080 [Nitrospinaceae bacterium]|nr:hypothetical protein [Nitrospinaceae bacterium]
MGLWVAVIWLVALPVQAGSIEDFCKKLEGDHLSSLQTCIEKENKAKVAVQDMEKDAKIFDYCKVLVGESWARMKVCIEKETELKEKSKN